MKGPVRLSLFVGPAVPLPAPRVVIDAVRSLKVTTTSDGPSAFQLEFELDKRSPLHTLFLLAGGAAPPLLRVVIAITVSGTQTVLMDGVMTHHQVTGGGSGSDPILTVTGEDLTRVMDMIDFTGLPYPAMPDFARVLVILGKYAPLGIIPMVIPSVLLDVPIPIDRIPRHQGKDLEYIRALAERVGYAFYIDPGPTPGVSRAYWGPEIRIGTPQPALNVDMGVVSNVRSLDFAYDSESATLPLLMLYLKETHTPLPIVVPPITPLSPPLGAVPPIPKNVEWIQGLDRYSPIQAAAIGMTKAAKSSDVVTGRGTLDVARYGRILHARKLVGVRGAGTAFDGLYYVKQVTHNLRRGSYTQDFQLVRNGLVSTVSRVAP